MTPLRSTLLDSVQGLVYGFGTRAENFPAALKEAWVAKRPQWKQVHGTAVVQVSRAGQECGEVDALFTREKGQPIAVVTADCVPVLLARKDASAVASVHAGWRGTGARILRRLWEVLAAQGERPEDWVGAVGPAIGPCCYEVSEELAIDFAREFLGAEKQGFGPAVPAHRRLDLPAINAAELKSLGVAGIDLLRACTRCSQEDRDFAYHSYRREGPSQRVGGARQWSAIQLR